MGGDYNSSVIERVRYKIQSAAHQEFNTHKIHSKLSSKIQNQRDIFGRRAKFKTVNIDKSFPHYLLEHLDDFDHLILKKPREGFFKKLLRFFS
jgi:beta-1,4-mannosyl-glycoprotein beta-1,4-N-acetylglucosaminyltransferase